MMLRRPPRSLVHRRRHVQFLYSQLIERSLANTGAKGVLSPVAQPSSNTYTGYNTSPVNGVVRFENKEWAGSLYLSGPGTNPVTRYEFINCKMQSLISYGNIPEVYAEDSTFSSGIYLNNPKINVKRCYIVARSTPCQIIRTQSNGTQGGTHDTPITIEDSYIAALGPLGLPYSSDDHCEAIHITGSRYVNILRNTLEVPVQPSEQDGTYSRGVTGIWNMDGTNEDMVIEGNILKSGGGTYWSYLNGTNILVKDNLIWHRGQTVPQLGGGAGASMPSKYPAAVQVNHQYVGNKWYNDGSPVPGWS